MNKIGILCAGDEELAPFLVHIANSRISEKASLRFYEGTIEGVSVVALYSGVCKVNAAIAAQILIDTYGVDAIINAGTAGGMAEDLRLFDTVISTQAAYHDVADEILTEFHPWLSDCYFPADKVLLQLAYSIAAGHPEIHLGTMVTGEKFIEDGTREDIIQKYAPLSVDMETAAVAHVCYANQIPFLAVRSITDTATHAGVEQFEKNCKQASHIAKDITLRILKELGKCVQ